MKWVDCIALIVAQYGIMCWLSSELRFLLFIVLCLALPLTRTHIHAHTYTCINTNTHTHTHTHAHTHTHIHTRTYTYTHIHTHTHTHTCAHTHTHTYTHKHTHTHTHMVDLLPMEARVMRPAMRSVMQSAVSNCFLARVAALGPLIEERKSSTVFLSLRRPTSY